MKLTLHTEVTIDSCHKLENYNGKCANLHGHTWLIEAWFQGSSNCVDKVGILVDFTIVKKLKDLIDHQYLNDVVPFNPTAENLTVWIYEFFKQEIASPSIGIKVRVYETAVGKQTWCEGGDFV